MKRVGFLVLVICVNAPSEINSSHGTILVSTMTEDEVTLAEDSRVIEKGEPKDDDCKIITLHGKIIFGFAGIRSFDTTAPTIHVAIHWEAHAAAIQAYKLSTRKTTHDVAEQFAILAAQDFGDSIKLWGLRRFVQQTGADPNAILAAIFTGTGSKGKPDQFVVDLSYSIPERKIVWTNKPVVLTAADSTPVKAYGSDTSVITEFIAERSFRSKNELAHWRQKMAGKSHDERISSLAVQFVKWEIMYTTEADIGGPVDYMVLSRAGIADHRKPSCQTTNQ